MPTTYAHDLFGQKYTGNCRSSERIIRKNGELYRIGLHGPDIFFYYFIFKNHVSSVGYRMHKEKARAFFAQGMAQVRETGDEALLAYLLGFGCHYLLDSSCHPFVNEMNDKAEFPTAFWKLNLTASLWEKMGKIHMPFILLIVSKAKTQKMRRKSTRFFPLVKTRRYSSEP